MSDESDNLSAKTWARTVDSINKVGYMDGAADGQTSTYQSSFDMGYEQGLSFGLELGFSEAMLSFQRTEGPSVPHLDDPRRINCQICLNNTTTQDNIVNLYNIQKEKNDEHLENIKTEIRR